MLEVLLPPSARDLTRTFMLTELAERGITAPWSSGIPAQRPAQFFTIEELNSATEFEVWGNPSPVDNQLLQIRAYSTDRKWVGETGRLIKALWAAMPNPVEHAGGPSYDEDPDIDGLYYGQVIAWVTVLNASA